MLSAASAEPGAVSLNCERLKKTEKHLKYEGNSPNFNNYYPEDQKEYWTESSSSYYSNHSNHSNKHFLPVLDPPPPYSEQILEHFEKAPASKVMLLKDVEFTDQVIGKGSYGIIHLAYYQNLKVATKSMHGILLKTDYCQESLMNECQTLYRIRHPNIVTCMGVHIKTDGTACLVMEYVKGSLYELVDALHEGSRTVSLRQKTHILFNINLALVYLHNHGILHGDLTSSNVLLDDNLNATVTDFGVSKLSSTQTTQSSTVNGNHYYTPLDECFTEKGDIFSSAVIAIELINQEHPRVDERECEEVNRRRCDLCDFHHKAPKQLHGLVMQCLEDDPNSRPTAKEIHSELNNFLEFLDTDSGEALSDRKFSQQASDLCKVVPPNEPGTEGFFLCPSKSSTKAAKSFVTEDTQEHENENFIYSTVSCLHPITTKRPKAEHVSPLPTLDEGSQFAISKEPLITDLLDEHSELVIGRSSRRGSKKSSPSKVVTKTMQTKESEMNTETQSSHAKGATNTVSNSEHTTIDGGCLSETSNLKPQTSLNHTDHVSLRLERYQPSPILDRSPCSTLICYCPTSIIRCTNDCTHSLYCVLRKRFIFSYGHLDIAIMMKEGIPIVVGARVVIGNYSVAVAIHISSNREELLKHHTIQQHLYFSLTERATNTVNNSDHSAIDSGCLLESPDIKPQSKSLVLVGYRLLITYNPCSTVNLYCPTSSISIIRCTSHCIRSFYSVLRERFIFSYGHLDIAIMMREDIPIAIGVRVVIGNYSVAVATHISSNQEELLKHRTTQHHVSFFLAFNNSEHTVIDSRFLCESPNPQISTNHVSLGLERYQPSPILVRSPCSTVIYYCPTSIIRSTNDCTRSLYCVLRKRFIFSYGHLDIAIMMKEDIPIVIGARVVNGNYSVAVATHISSNQEELLKHHTIQQHLHYHYLTERATNTDNNSDHSAIDSGCLLESPDIKPQSKSLVLVGYRLLITYNPCSTVNLYCPTSSISIIRCTSHCIRSFYSVLRERFIFSYGHLDIAIMMREDIPIAIGVRVVIGNYSVAVAIHISSNQEELLKHHTIQHHVSFFLAFNNSEHTVIDSRFLCESPNPQISTDHVSLGLERYQPSPILVRSPCSTVICYCPTSIIRSTNDCTRSLYCVLRKRFIFSYGHLDIAIMMKEGIPIVVGVRVVIGNYSVAVATHISSNQEELLKHRTVQTSECLVSMKNTSGSSLQKNIHIHTETCASKFAPGPTDFVEWSLCKRITSAGTATISRIMCVICKHQQTYLHTKLYIPNEKHNMLFSEIFIALLTGQLVAYKLHRLSSFHYLWSYSTEISKFDESTSCNGMLIPNNVLQQKLSTTTMYEFHHSSKYCYCTLRIVHNTTITEFALLSALHNIINQSSVRYNWSNLHKSNTRLTYNLLPLMNSSLLTVKKAYVSTTSMLFRKLFIGNLQEKQQQLSLICSFTNVSHMTMHQGKSNISCKFSTNFQCVKMPHSLQAHLYRSCAVHQEPSNTGLTMMKLSLLNIKVTRYCYFYQNNFNECCRVAMTMTVRVSTPNREYCIFRYAITKMILHKHNHLMTLVETQSETFFPMPENIPVFMATNMDYPEPQNCLMLSNETKDILPKNEHFCSHALTNIARVNQALSSTQPKKTHCMRDLSHTQPSRCHSTKQPEIINSQPRITKVERKRRKRRKRCSRDSPTTTGKKRRIQSDGCDRQGGVSRKRINSKKVQILQTKKTRCSRDPLGTTSKKRKSHDDGYDRWNSVGRRRNSSRQVKVYKTKRKRTRKKRKYSTDYDTILCDTACIRFSTTKAMRWYINKTKRKKHVRMMTKMCGESRRIRVRCWMAKKWPAITKYIKNLPHILPLDLNQPVRVMCTLQSGSSNTASGGSSNAASSGKGSSGNPCDRGGTDNHASPGSAGNGKRRDDDDNDGNRDKKTMPDKDVDPDYESSDSEEDDNWPYQGKTGPKPESTLQFQVPPKGKESGTESDGKEKRTQYNSLPPQSYDGLNSEHLHGTKHPMGSQLHLPKGTNKSSQAETKPSLNDGEFSLPKPFVTVTDIDHDIDTSTFDDLASAPIEETSTPESKSDSVLGNYLTLKSYDDLEVVTGFLPLNSNYLLLCPLTSNHRDNEDSDEYDALEQQEEQLNEDLEDNQQGSQDISNHHDNEDSDGSVYYDALEQQEEQLNDEQDFDQQGSQDVTIEVGDGGHESDDHRWEAAEEYTEDDRSHLVEVNNDHRDNDLEEAEEESEFTNSAETVPTLVSIRPSKLDTQLSNVATVCVPTQEEIEMMTPHDAALLGHHYQAFSCCMGPDNIHPGSLCTDPVQERPVMVSNFYMGMLTHTISPSLSDLNIT